MIPFLVLLALQASYSIAAPAANVAVATTTAPHLTCFGAKCYDSSKYSKAMIRRNCPVAVCGTACYNFVTNAADNCPICRCNGFATREPCTTSADCPKGIQCAGGLCTYPAVNATWKVACDFPYQCGAAENCTAIGTCLAISGSARHLPDQACIFDNQCPSKHACQQATCWEAAVTTAQHLSGITCAFDWMCPSGYRCIQLSCVADPKAVHIYNQPCLLTSQCPSGYSCKSFTCNFDS